MSADDPSVLSEAGRSQRREIRVLTINIWNRQGPWPRRLALLREGIAKLAPDVVGLQEVLSDGHQTLAHEIAEGLGFEVHYGEAKALAGGITIGNAALSRFPRVGGEIVPLPSAGADEARSVLVVELDTGRGALPLLVTHLAWRFHHGFVRERQVLALAALLERRFPVRRDVLPPVLVGDFNAPPDATEMRFLRGLHALDGRSTYLADCFGDVGEGPGFTFDAQRNPFAAPTREPRRRIDYIFVRGPDGSGRGAPLASRVVLDEIGDDGVAASDHWGVVAEIAM